MEYKEFMVIIKDQNNIWIKKPGQTMPDEHEVHLEYLKKETIDIFCRWLATGNITRPEELSVLGSYLFDILFNTATTKAFKEEVDKITEKSSLRLVLEFREDARELAELPWEYLYFPDTPMNEWGKGFFIAASPGLILTRHVPLQIDNLQRSPKPLRILIVVSQPEDLSEIDAEPVIKTIEELKNSLPDVIETDKLFQPTRRSLTEKVKDFKPHVLHFIGHGRYMKEGGELAFVKEDDLKSASWIRDMSLVDSFQVHQPRLIFLHACEGAKSESYESFRGMALKLVYSRIPAVVAMQYEVENIVANKFAKRFYQSLGEGKRIDEAVQDGRRELGMFLKEEESFSSRAFGSPVVYMQSGEGIIIAEEVPPPIGIGPQPIPPTKGPCPYPDCNGYVISDDAFCYYCKRDLMQCPKCKKVIGKDLGVCLKCKYKIGEVKADQERVEHTLEKSLDSLSISNGVAEAKPLVGLSMKEPKTKKHYKETL